MTEFFDWLLAFAGKVMAVPELHAIIVAIAVGMAIAYLFTLQLPHHWAIDRVKRWSSAVVMLAVFLVATGLGPHAGALQLGWIRVPLPAPGMAAWAFVQAVFTPLYFTALGNFIYHRWPWLQPKALKS